MDRVLITGGAGFIGTHLLSRLIQKGVEVTVLDNGFRGNLANLNLDDHRIRIVNGDVRDSSVWASALKDVDTVVHLAAINGTRYFSEIPTEVLDVNVKGVLNLIDAVRKHDVQRVLFSSSSEVYGYPRVFPTPEDHELLIPNPLNPRFSYAASKILGEMLCINNAKKYGFEYTIVRFHNVYGPRMGWEHVIPQFIKRVILNEEFTVQGNGTQTRSFCYIDDAIDATLLVLTHPLAANQIFNVGNPEEVTINQLIQELSRISNGTVKPVYIPDSTRGTPRRVPDTRRIAGLGFSPKVPLRQGLKSTFDWYRNALLSKANILE